MKYVFKLIMFSLLLTPGLGRHVVAQDEFDLTLRTNGDYSEDNEVHGYDSLGPKEIPAAASSMKTAQRQVEMRCHALVPDGELSFPLDIKQDWDFRFYIRWREDGLLQDMGSSDGWQDDDEWNGDEDLSLSEQRNVYLQDHPGIVTLDLYKEPYDAIPFEPGEPGDEIHFYANFRTWVRGDGLEDYSETQNWHVHIVLEIVPGPTYPGDPWDVLLEMTLNECGEGLAELPEF